MTIGFIGCRMTLRDFAVCRALLANLGGRNPPLAAILRDKLDRATIVADDAIDPLTVTLNSRVDFSIDGETPQRRILVGSTFRNGLVGLTLPVATPRGVALLGLRRGQTAAFEEGGVPHRIAVVGLLYQPEAARWGHAPPPPPQAPPADILDLARARQARAAQDPSAGDRAGTNFARKGTQN